MARGFADGLALFCLPFVLYAVLLLVRPHLAVLAPGWSGGRLAMLTVAGLVLVLAGMLVFGLAAPRHQGGYAPAHLDHGRLVPGQIE